MNTMTPGDPGMRTVNGTTSKLGLLRGGHQQKINQHSHPRLPKFFFERMLTHQPALGHMPHHAPALYPRGP